MEFAQDSSQIQEGSNVAIESLEETLSTEPIPEQDKDTKDTNDTSLEVKDANEESSSTDDKEADPEANPEADPEAELEADPQAELKTENVPEAETTVDSTETKEGASTPEVLEPVIIVEDKKKSDIDEITTNL